MSRLRRSILYMPGDSLRKITKATQLDVDCVVMDLEDGVAPSNKEEARTVVREAITTLDFGTRERLIRINPLDGPWGQDDLNSTIDLKPDGYVIPKVESAATLQQLDERLTAFEKAQGWAPQSIRLLALIETAKGVIRVAEIAAASPRVDALMFGAEDLAGDVGAQRTPEGLEVLYARSAVVTAAAAFGLMSIDTVFIAYQDHEGLERECRFAKQLGYVGKMAIHPKQVVVMNRVFAPSAEEVDGACRMLQAFQTQQAQGVGAFSFEGKMIDMPMIRGARTVVSRAIAAGLLSPSDAPEASSTS